METTELIMKEEHPPHPTPYKEKGLPLPRIFLRIAVLAAIFILFFHSRNLTPLQYTTSGIGRFTEELFRSEDRLQIPVNKVQEKEKAIREILRVLEKYPTGLAEVTKEEIAEVIYEEAVRHNQDPKFILALIATESSFQNWSVSEKGAKGLMQIMPYVAQSLAQEMDIEWSGDRTLFNPFLNIRMGIYYLSQLIVDFEDFKTALTAYNYGPTYVRGLIQRKEKIPGDYYLRLLNVYEEL